MLNIFIDLETLPDANGADSYIETAKDNIKVPSTLTKPKLIEALNLGADGKYKTVDELKEMWVSEFGSKQAQSQGDEAWRKTSFDGSKGSICVIGCDSDLDTLGAFETTHESEKEMLINFWKWVEKTIGNHTWRFVAHNAKFDLPFLYHRSVINGVKPVYYNPHGRHGQHHYCTMEAWAGFGGRISMDNLAKTLGVSGKGDMDGSKVYDTWQVDPEKVIDYCIDDVVMLRKIYNKLEFV